MPDAPHPDWLDTTVEPEPESESDRRRTRLPLLLAVAAVPWIGLAGLLVRGSGPETAPPHPQPTPTTWVADAAEASPPTPPAAPSAPAATPAPSDLPTLAEPGLTPQQRVGEIAAAVTAIARTRITSVGPRLDIPGIDGDDPAYLEHVEVEAIEQVGDHLFVARVLALVLTPDGDVYTGVTLHRLGVPVRLTTDAVLPAGAPWRLPAPERLEVDAPVGDEVDDPELLQEARHALGRAGLHGELSALASTDEGPWVATVEVAEGEAIEVWLVDRWDGFAVAGTPPGPVDETPTTEDEP